VSLISGEPVQVDHEQGAGLSGRRRYASSHASSARRFDKPVSWSV